MSESQITLSAASYGKSSVRLVKLIRDGAQHELRDLTVDVALEGDFAACYVDGDNRAMAATDTMRNTVYALARVHPLDSPEAFAIDLARRLLRAGPTVSAARVELRSHPWQRLSVDGAPHPHCFVRGAGDQLASARADAAGGLEVGAGLADLLVMKTTGSAWVDFYRDELATLPDADDRIMATVLSARWSYGAAADLDFAALWPAAQRRLLQSFGDHESPSVQHTLYRMGRDLLQAFPAIERVHLALPNRHHLRFDLAPLGLDNPNLIFHVTSEPYGLIEGTLGRAP